MWWVLVGAGVAAILGGMKSDEKKAAERFHSKQAQMRREMYSHRTRISHHRNTANRNLRFHQLCNLHFESHLVNQAAWETFQDALLSCRGINRLIGNARKEKARLKVEIKAAEKRRDIREAERLGEKHRVIYHTLNGLYSERKILFKQKEQFHDEMVTLMSRTRELKLMIRDTCGYRGAEWYDSIQAKTREKRLLSPC